MAIDYTGQADSTADLQALVDAGSVTLEPGTIKISAPIVITKPIAIRGAGKYQTMIRLASPTQDGFQIVSTDPAVPVNGPIIRDLGMISDTGQQTAGTGIRIGTAAAPVHEVHLAGISMLRLFDCVTNVSGAFHLFEDLRLITFANNGVDYSNLHNVDSGDSVICNSRFHANATGTANASIVWRSGGGIKIYGNKILQGVHGVLVGADTSQGSTANILISGNSMESQSYACIRIRQATGGGILKRPQIVGNQINPDGNFGLLCETLGTRWIQDVLVSGNIFSLRNSLRAIDMAGVDGGIISGNHFTLRGPASNEHGIYLRGPSGDVRSVANSFFGIAAAREWVNAGAGTNTTA